MSLSPDEVRAHEEAVDSALAGTPLPSGSFADSAWYLLTVLEDESRTWLQHLFEMLEQDDLKEESKIEALNGFTLRLNDERYALRHALDQARARCTGEAAGPWPPADVDGEAYVAAREVLKAARGYTTAATCFTVWHNGGLDAAENDDGEIVFEVVDRLEGGYEVLEQAGHESRARQPSSGNNLFLLRALWGAGEWVPQLSGYIGQKARKVSTPGGNDTLVYDYDGELGRHLYQLVRKDAELIPDGWVFPWGERDDVLAVRAGLYARCLYHMVAVNFGSRLWSELGMPIEGGGVEAVCLSISEGDLVGQITALCGRDEERVRAVVRSITYGTDTETPDPALQPVFPFSDDVVLVPASILATDNFERNQLSLHARVDPASFDSSSASFERGMVAELIPAVESRFSHSASGTHVPGQRGAGEVDMILADPESRFVLVGEYRWVLQPGDPREVVNKRRACTRKAAQARRKVEAVEAALRETLEALGVEVGSLNDWDVGGAVVIAGYPGAPSPDPAIPIVPQSVFESALGSARTARELYEALHSLDWLPQEGEDFEVVSVEASVGDVTLHAPAISFDRGAVQRRTTNGA